MAHHDHGEPFHVPQCLLGLLLLFLLSLDDPAGVHRRVGTLCVPGQPGVFFPAGAQSVFDALHLSLDRLVAELCEPLFGVAQADPVCLVRAEPDEHLAHVGAQAGVLGVQGEHHAQQQHLDRQDRGRAGMLAQSAVEHLYDLVAPQVLKASVEHAVGHGDELVVDVALP